MARPKCLMRDFANLSRIYKAHQTNVWWTMKVFWLHWNTILHIIWDTGVSLWITQYMCGFWAVDKYIFQVLPLLGKRTVVDVEPLDGLYKWSGTKPKLVAKILATNLGVLFVIHVYVMFSKLWYGSDNNVKNIVVQGFPVTGIRALEMSEGY